MRRAPLFFSSLLLTVATGAAQGVRTEYTFHVYVDANFGDNEQAWLRNPFGVGQPLPLSTHPDASSPIAIHGFLQHAPYAFATLTSPNPQQPWGRGVIEWITTNFVALPWSHPQQPFTVEQVVIHVLPGVYGPKPGSGGVGQPSAYSPYPDPVPACR